MKRFAVTSLFLLFFIVSIAHADNIQIGELQVSSTAPNSYGLVNTTTWINNDDLANSTFHANGDFLISPDYGVGYWEYPCAVVYGTEGCPFSLTDASPGYTYGIVGYTSGNSSIVANSKTYNIVDGTMWQVGFDSGFNGSIPITIDALPLPTPEPSSILLIGAGLAGVAGALRRKLSHL